MIIYLILKILKLLYDIVDFWNITLFLELSQLLGYGIICGFDIIKSHVITIIYKQEIIVILFYHYFGFVIMWLLCDLEYDMCYACSLSNN